MSSQENQSPSKFGSAAQKEKFEAKGKNPVEDFPVKDHPYLNFTPCECKSACGEECPHANGAWCEKYCGCAKTCERRFIGCRCANGQCLTHRCLCFDTARECDPDVCRNCSIGFGDENLGFYSPRGGNCENMKISLGQKQRVFLRESDVSGLGAFLQNNIASNEYIGEYTGELISHGEAERRSKIFDHNHQPFFLFDLNDQFVLDGFQKGGKLNFANHSPDPNCFARVMMVQGNHRVGIYAKKDIKSGDELFLDYKAFPAWPIQTEAPDWEEEEVGSSSGPAKNLA